MQPFSPSRPSRAENARQPAGHPPCTRQGEKSASREVNTLRGIQRKPFGSCSSHPDQPVRRLQNFASGTVRPTMALESNAEQSAPLEVNTLRGIQPKHFAQCPPQLAGEVRSLR